MVRDLDVVCRFAGEKFGIVLPNTQSTMAKILAERIRQNIGDNKIQVGTWMIRLTVSIGMACFEGKNNGAQNLGPKTQDPTPLSGPDLVRQALHALALSMEKGGNQIQS